MAHPVPPPPPGAPPSSYFDKKGEVNELRQLLRSVAMDRDIQKKRDAIKKTIAYMTLGIDVSRLFSEMVMASSTTDLVQKKMIYLYLVNYAQSNADLAILAVNTLQKDCRDDDPSVRGLALRNLCSLTMPNMVEYLNPAINQALTDRNGYVRKTAVIGVIKLFYTDPTVVEDAGHIDTLYKMLSDSDPDVVANVIHALSEILQPTGGMVLTRQLATHLLNRITSFSEWGQCSILNLISKYTPQDEKEMYDIMNIIECLLKHSSSAVVLAVTKVFVDLTADNPSLHRQVLERLKAPLLTLMSVATPELSYTVLVHIALLMKRGHAGMQDEYKQFFCRYNDPSYIRSLKLEILQLLANENNVEPIVAELSEYVTDVDAEMGRKSIRAIGQIAMRLTHAADHIIENLLGFLQLNIDYVSTETVVVMKDLLRKYHQHFTKLVNVMDQCVNLVTEPEGRCAVLWMLGEYGESIVDAPYLVEPMIDNFEEESPLVKLELMTCALKLLFKRCPEMVAMVGRLLKVAIAETHPDVRDRALLYYRLLESSVHDARRVINCPKEPTPHFLEDCDDELLGRIFQEFNTLSVVYNQPAHKWCTKPPIQFKQETAPTVQEPVHEAREEYVPAAPAIPATPAADLLATPPVGPTGDVGDLLDMGDDLLDLNGGHQASFTLAQGVVLNSQAFQSRWAGLSSVNVDRRSVSTNLPTSPADVERLIAPLGIRCMASGAMGQMLKFFFYAQQESGPPPSGPGAVWFLMELQMPTTPHQQAIVTVKSENAQPASVTAFLNAFWHQLSPFLSGPDMTF